MKKRQSININISDATAQQLATFLNELGIDESQIIEQALTHYFDILDEKLASKRLKELEEGKVKPVPASEVWAELEL